MDNAGDFNVHYQPNGGEWRRTAGRRLVLPSNCEPGRVRAFSHDRQTVEEKQGQSQQGALCRHRPEPKFRIPLGWARSQSAALQRNLCGGRTILGTGNKRHKQICHRKTRQNQSKTQNWNKSRSSEPTNVGHFLLSLTSPCTVTVNTFYILGDTTEGCHRTTLISTELVGQWLKR